MSPLQLNSDISSLPPEMLTRIFSFLNVSEKGTVTQVCSGWRDVSYTNKCIWRAVEALVNLEKTNASGLLKSLEERGVVKIKVISLDRIETLKSAVLSAPNLEALDIYAFKTTEGEDIGGEEELFKHISTHLKRLKSITYSNGYLIASVVLHLSRMSTLTHVEFLTISNLGLWYLAQTTSPISSLKVHFFAEPKNLPIAIIARGLQKLETVTINVSSELDLKYLADLPNLRDLTITGRRLKEGVTHLAKSRAPIKNLTLSDYEISNAELVEVLSGLTHLKSITINNAHRITEMGLQVLGETSNLERISLLNRMNSSTNVGMQYLATSAITYLVISNTIRVNDNGLEILSEGLRKLESIDLSNCANVSDLGLSHLVKLPNLRYVSIRDLEVTDEGMRYLANGVSPISHLDISWTKVGDRGLYHLSQGLSTLRAINLNHCHFSDTGLKHLAALPNLKQVMLPSLGNFAYKLITKSSGIVTLAEIGCRIYVSNFRLGENPHPLFPWID